MNAFALTTTTFQSNQIQGTTDQNILLTCTDSNIDGYCKLINYNINEEGWNNILVGDTTNTNYYDTAEHNTISSATFQHTIYYYSDTNTQYLDEDITMQLAKVTADFDIRAVINYVDGTSYTSNEITHDTGTWATKTLTGWETDKYVYSVDIESKYHPNESSGYGKFRNTSMDFFSITNVIKTLSLIYSGVGDHNIQYYSTNSEDNNESIKTSYFSTAGAGKMIFYDETDSLLNDISYIVSPSINGIFNGTLTDTNYIDLNFSGITSGVYSFSFSKTGYTSKAFNLTLNQYSDFNYEFVFIETGVTSSVDFQVFDEFGVIKSSTVFISYDNTFKKYNDIQPTDSLGRITFNLSDNSSDYNFFSLDLNFGTTTWTINKPVDAVTLAEISGDWKYSITGNSYSSATNIASGITKLLLQNTVNPYYMSAQDVNESYVETTFGLISITSEKTKTLTPFLYKLGDAELRLLIVKDYATNQPISRQIQLDLSLYTDSNGFSNRIIY